MNLRTKKLIIISFAILFISASVLTVLALYFFYDSREKSTIVFTPNYIKSFPNHTAWLLAKVSIYDSDLLDNCFIIVQTNETIDLEFKVWNNEPSKKVLEIFIKPNSTHLNDFVKVEAIINNDKTCIKGSAIIEVIHWFAKNISEVIGMRDEFISYLAINKSSFGINESIIWEGFDNRPQILIVEHYLFRSEFWEMELSRHVMIAPHDWVQVYLRLRNQIQPIWSGIISSWSSENHTVTEIEPPSSVSR